jgi:hypothetical protein
MPVELVRIRQADQLQRLKRVIRHPFMGNRGGALAE